MCKHLPVDQIRFNIWAYTLNVYLNKKRWLMKNIITWLWMLFFLQIYFKLSAKYMESYSSPGEYGFVLKCMLRMGGFLVSRHNHKYTIAGLVKFGQLHNWWLAMTTRTTSSWLAVAKPAARSFLFICPPIPPLCVPSVFFVVVKLLYI